MRLSPSPEQLPGVQRLLVESRGRRRIDLVERELAAELVVGGLFLIVAVLLPGIAGVESFDVWPVAVAVIGLVLAAGVVFQVGSCYTMAIQVAFVPLLFVAPAALVPLLVAFGLLTARAFDVAVGKRRLSRLVNALADSWFAIGPAVVLVVDGSPAANEVSVAVLLAAFAAQLAVDASASRVREWLHHGASLREQLAESAWIYLVDALLAPIGFAIALAAAQEPWAVILSWPLLMLFAIFAHEREDRLSSLIELSDAYRGTARVLGDVVEHDDAYTGMHLRGVAELAIAVAAELGLDAKQRRLVEFGALLHDVGKIAIPKEIINKAGPLSDPEWQVIRTHTIAGQEMLSNIGGLMREVGEVVRSSHERFDGDGYPDRLAGHDIPIESRVVFCCDAYNAMTTTRPYRAAMPPAAAVAEMRANAGTQFDPVVVDALLRRLDALDIYRD